MRDHVLRQPGPARRGPRWPSKLVAVGALVFLFWATGCSNDGSAQPPVSTPTGDTTAEPGTPTMQPQPTRPPPMLDVTEYPVGEILESADATPGAIAQVGAVRMTFNQILDPWTLAPDANSRTVAFELSMRNFGPEPYEADIAGLTLIDSEGVERGEASMLSSTPYQPRLTDALAQGPIEAGTYVRGWVAFEVGKDDQLQTLRYTVDAELGQTIEFRLQAP